MAEEIITPAPPHGLDLPAGIRVRADGVRFQYARSGGPGGQNVNKLNTKAELWVRLDAIEGLSINALGRLRAAAGKRLTQAGEIHLVSEAGRSQEGNRQEVAARLREMIETSMREPKKRRKTRPTHASRLRRLKSKQRRSEVKANRRSAGRED